MIKPKIFPMLTFPNAKINIGLNVVSRREDGYHDLETVFYPIPLHDNLEISLLQDSDDDYSLQVCGNSVDCPPENNLVIKALKSLKKNYPEISPIDVYLYKRIPTGAGLGGGSSDAAYMIKSINDLFSLNLSTEQMKSFASKLGADCAFFISNKPAFATGIGDDLAEIDFSLKGYTLALIKPAVSVSTAEAYRGVEPLPSSTSLPDDLKRPVNEWRHFVKNDFEKSVFASHPEIAAIKETLYDMGAEYASMSGSGSSVFGLFTHPIDNLKDIFSDCFAFQQRLDK